MAVRQGSIAAGEHETDAETTPRRVYWIEESAGVYVPAVGSSGEADAWLMEESAGVFVLTDTEAEEDRVAMLVGTSTILI
jgi:hypothetical protein